MLWMVLAPAVPTKAQPTGYMDITVYVSTDTPIYLPVSLTVPYMLQLVDPSSGTINILYPNRMLNISNQQLVTIGSYSVDSISNKITFWTGVNITAAGNYTCNFRLIYDSTLMANNTIDTSLHVYSAFPWMYRVPIIVGNASSALTNYQIGLYLDLSAQVSAGKIRSDLGDLRFNDSSGNGLSYWIENATTSAAKIWVNVTSIPASPSTTTIYMYYGNPSATTTSNGFSTFVLFDDFNRADSATVGNGWTEDEGGGTLSISGNTLYIYQYANYYCHIEKSGTYPVNFELRGMIKSNQYAQSWRPTIVAYWGSYDYVKIGPQSTGSHMVEWDIAGTVSNTASGTATANTWYYYRIRGNSTSVWCDWSADGVTWNTVTTIARPSSWSGAPTMVIVGKGYAQSSSAYPNADLDNSYSTAGSLETSYADNVFMRTFAYPEPTYSVGSEQQLVNYAYSVSYGQLSTESQLTVRIPAFSPVQTFTANVSGSYTAPTPLPDAIKIIYNMEYGRYALALLPILFMLVAGKHYAGIMGIFACGMSALINVTVGVALFDWTVLGIIAFVCILLIFTEGG